MKVGIIGAGNVGGTLGRLWTARGHEVFFGVRDPFARPPVSRGKAPTVRSGSVAQAAEFGDVVVLATPWGATRDAIQAAGSLSGKVVIDCTNPLAEDLAGLAIGHSTSAAEEVARWAPGAQVVKCFNTLGAQNFPDPLFGDQRASMFLCGDDRRAKDTVAALGVDLGFDMIDAGPLTRARLLEPLAMLWISLAYAQGLGPRIAFKLLRE